MNAENDIEIIHDARDKVMLLKGIIEANAESVENKGAARELRLLADSLGDLVHDNINDAIFLISKEQDNAIGDDSPAVSAAGEGDPLDDPRHGLAAHINRKELGSE